LDAKNVGDDLSPEKTFGSAARGTHLGELQTLLANDCEAIVETKSDTFEHGTDEMASIMTRCQANPAATSIRIQVRRALTLKIRKEDESVAPRRHTLGLLGQEIVRILTCPPFECALWQTDVVSHPSQ